MYYTFDHERYADTDAGKQELLEAVSEAIREEAYSDSSLSNPEEAEEAHSMSFDGTSRDMAFWDNCIAIMQHCPYELDIKRVEGDDDE